jgi:spore maturation protein CgeB
VRILFLNDAPIIRLGLAAGFRELGHDVLYLVFTGQPDCPRFPAANRNLTGARRLWEVDQAEQFPVARKWLDEHGSPDLLIFEGFTGGDPVQPEAILLLKGHSAPFFYWAIEDPLWTREVIDAEGRKGPYASVADHIFTPAIECTARYQDSGVASSLLTFACNPQFHRSVQIDPGFASDVVLVASNYAWRTPSLFDWLLSPALAFCRKHGLRFRIYGWAWDRQGNMEEQLAREKGVLQGPLQYELLPSVYSSARLVLGAEQCLNQSATQSSMRVFEALGCSSCYLGPRHRAHQALFDEGREVVFTNGAEETLLALDRLLGDDDLRRSIGRAGQRKCYSRHTYTHRAMSILEVYRREWSPR